MNKQTLTEKILIFDRGAIELVESGDLVGSKVIPVEDVKEFIKDFDNIEVEGLDETCKRLMIREIKERAGKGLTNG